ncbi:hypothetical protein ABGT17_13780 [Rossellomorea marisflavi]
MFSLGLSIASFMLSFIGISHHKTRIRELTFAVGDLIDRIDKLEDEKGVQ